MRFIYRLGLLNEGNKQAGVVLRSILANNREIFGILVNNRDFFPLTVLPGFFTLFISIMTCKSGGLHALVFMTTVSPIEERQPLR